MSHSRLLNNSAVDVAMSFIDRLEIHQYYHRPSEQTVDCMNLIRR